MSASELKGKRFLDRATGFYGTISGAYKGDKRIAAFFYDWDSKPGHYIATRGAAYTNEFTADTTTERSSFRYLTLDWLDNLEGGSHA